MNPPERDDWRLFRGDGVPRHMEMPPAPPWRRFGGGERPSPEGERLSPEGERPSPEEERPSPEGERAAPGEERAVPGEEQAPPASGRSRPAPYLIAPEHADVVNAALHLRRPLLVTGSPGTGKSSLARAIAHELDLGEVLRWPVNSRSTVQDALYRYDAIGRLRETALRRDRDEAEPDIGSFVRLGPLGTALVPGERPRALLVDELDKGDVDLPNDLLTVFEEGEFEIPELARLPEDQSVVEVLTERPGERATVRRGRLVCDEFPVVVITSNGERDFPPAFLRRCVRLELPTPDEGRLRAIVTAHLGDDALEEVDQLLDTFLRRRAARELATDQLLNAVFLRAGGMDVTAEGLLEAVLHRLGGAV
ncbi:AAA family ATPase [Streptomyces malaysiensis]|uniref:AAA family ATPase n=1 Tax=Streptomyces malaysiensis TaxID=92644 RepID=UPI000BFF2004|nr:MoxR family ATPase [Streptomyces malaysiensis]ATL86311.1 ATPase, AAA family protein [Streptomyces malaysiensis]